MKRPALFSICIFLLSVNLSAQYATTGTGNRRNEIWWFDWAGFNLTEGASRSFTTFDGMIINIKFTNVSAHVPQPYVMNTWSGAILHLLYDFNDPAVQPALFDMYSTEPSSFTMTVTALRNGLPIDFSLIAADAEATDNNETNTLQTSGAAWQSVEFLRNSTQTINPANGCGTKNVVLQNTYGGAALYGQNPVLLTKSQATLPLVINIDLDHGGTIGGVGLAFGILDAVDQGDLPVSYGIAQHQLNYTVSNSCNTDPPLPTTTQINTLLIGTVAGDADPVLQTDDNAQGVDEDGISSFPVYSGNGVYSLQISLSNNTGANAYLSAWFDYNRNGNMDIGESVVQTIPNNAVTANITWTGLPVNLPAGIVSGYAFRFRISSDAQAIISATGYAKDGEVEDYYIPLTDLCSLSIVASQDTVICPGGSAVLHVSGGTSFAWDHPESLLIADPANPVATPLVTTLYTVNSSNTQGCLAKAMILVTVLSNPIATLNNDTIVCKGTTLNLSASGGVNYIWTSSDGLTQATGPVMSISPMQSVKYFVHVKDNNSCSVTDSVLVTVHTLSIFSVDPAAPQVCENEAVLLNAKGGDFYAWYNLAGNLISTNASLTVFPASPDDQYQVQITDKVCAVTQTFQIPITLIAAQKISVTKSNDIDCSKGQSTLKAIGGYNYTWQSEPGISSLTVPDPIVSPLKTTTYHVKATGMNGCSTKDSITVTVDYTKALSKYPVPSAFTPNNDGKNDCFELKYWGSITNFGIEIFNRWGQRVFFSHNPQACWDGTFNGSPQPEGGYVYQIKAETPCGTAYRNGTVILIR